MGNYLRGESYIVSGFEIEEDDISDASGFDSVMQDGCLSESGVSTTESGLGWMKLTVV
jgi:hypothetical protein